MTPPTGAGDTSGIEELAALAVVVTGLLMAGAPTVLQVLWLTAIAVVAGGSWWSVRSPRPTGPHR